MGSKAPAAPDYTGAAQAQSSASERIARDQTAANRPNINTPFGSVGWSQTPGAFDQSGFDAARTQAQNDYLAQHGGNSLMDGAARAGVDSYMQDWERQNRANYQGAPQWQMDLNLPPEMQAALQSQQQLAHGRSDMALGMLDQAGSDLKNGLDWNSLQSLGSGMDARNRAEDAIYQRATSRLDPQFSQRQDQLRSQLYNQGLTEGDAAYDQQMANFGRERNDAYQNARDAAIMGGGQEMSRQFGQDLQTRQQGISEGLQRQYGGMNALNAFLAGQQVSQPNMPGFMGASAGQAPNLLGAAQAGGQYGLDAANQQNQLLGSMFGAGGSLGAAALMSDARLKEDIVLTDREAIPGVRYAHWRWKHNGKRGFGVIAQHVQKVRPDLVVTTPSGHLAVSIEVFNGA